ncbi:DUF4339 domain-containing protein [Leptolyngbya sp. AN02str]|uniref:DUF4339 domain-containing protein n=1 Tax=Leptolyngbya sp. AN02str TaxID=3423363 RepID=UPI003D316733
MLTLVLLHRDLRETPAIPSGWRREDVKAVSWYYKRMDHEVGPLSPTDLVQAVMDGVIVPSTEVRQEPGDWMPASKVSGLFERAKLSQNRALQDSSAGAKASAIAPPSGFPNNKQSVCSKLRGCDSGS